MSILTTITEKKKIEVSSRKKSIPVSSLQKRNFFTRETYSFKDFLTDEEKNGIIAEFKRKSPSKGIINDQANVADVITGYEKAGASAVSILTDSDFFGGSEKDIEKIRQMVRIPVLRKEFIIDEYQVYESKSIGADAILLIAAVLTKKQSLALAKLAHDLHLQVLMEFHDEAELGLFNEHIDIAGINNRNLKTFEVSLEHSVRLASKLPADVIKISESGISSPDDIRYLKNYGFRGFLIGENFMKDKDPVQSFVRFTRMLKG